MLMNNAIEYFRLAREREAIRRRRAAGEPWPWSADAIFREWRFCNVHREHDKTTVWFREHVRSKIDGWRVVEATRRTGGSLQEVGAALGARLIVTDFHPDALRAGHRRTFRDPRGALREIETHPHTPDAHAAAAQAAGFSSADVREYRVGPLVKTLYEAAGRRAHYDQDVGLPLVFGLGCLAY